MSNKQVTQMAKDLIAAKKLISDTTRWCTGTARRHQLNGNIRYCSIGALQEVLGLFERPGHPTASSRFRDAVWTLNEVVQSKYRKLHTIVQVNDYKGRKAALEVFDIAITNEIAKQREKSCQ